MLYYVYILGQQYSVNAGSLIIDARIGKRSTASFGVHTTTIQTHFQQYQPVKI